MLVCLERRALWAKGSSSCWRTTLGPGMSAEDRERAFEPFYSTREDGTGLGLAVVDRIVAAHGGTVVIDSSDKPGTTITVRLPLM